MTRTAVTPEPLYQSERQIADRVGMTPEEWRGTAAVLERSGLPRIDPVFGRRYWPAVKAFFDRRNGLAQTVPVAQIDGAENWNDDGGKRRGRPHARASDHRP